MLKVNNYNTASYYNSRAKKSNAPVTQLPNAGKQQSFGCSAANTNKALKWLKDQFNIDSNGSLTRAMFIFVAGVIMVGFRYSESRDKDEKREVLTRDIPAVLISVLGAPFVNKTLSYKVTKNTGIPIAKIKEPESNLLKPFKSMHANFSSQKQLIDWYSNLGENAAENFTKTIDENGGKIVAAFEKLGFMDKLRKITDSTKNSEIRDAISKAKADNTEAFKELETALKTLDENNSLLKYAKKIHARVKIAGIAVAASILGGFLPHLNIVVTRNKYKKKLEAGQIDKAEYEKKMIKASTVFKVSNGILSFHKASAAKTFKNLLDMVEKPVLENKE